MPAAQQALDVVEFDGHRLDVRLKVVVRDPLGFEQEFEIDRLWLLVILDICTRAVLGYHLVLEREYSRYDVIKTIDGRHTRAIPALVGERLLRGAPGSLVKLAVFRGRTEPIEISVTRERLAPQPVRGRRLEQQLSLIHI